MLRGKAIKISPQKTTMKYRWRYMLTPCTYNLIPRQRGINGKAKEPWPLSRSDSNRFTDIIQAAT